MKLDFCVVCGTKENLQQHHIVPVVISKVKRNIKKYDDSITVCSYHHNLIHDRKINIVNHRELTLIGLNQARINGVKIGRKSKTTDEQKKEILLKINAKQSISSIAREYSISRASVISIRKSVQVAE